MGIGTVDSTRDARLRGSVSGSPQASLLNELEVKTETRQIRFHPHAGDFHNDCFCLLRFHSAIIPDAREMGSSPEKTNPPKKGILYKNALPAWRGSADLLRLRRCGDIWKNFTFIDVFNSAMFYFYKRINQSAASLVREITSPGQNFIVVHDQSLGRKFSTLRLVDESPPKQQE